MGPRGPWGGAFDESAAEGTIPSTKFTCGKDTGDADVKYTGLDRFGRLDESIWKPASGPSLVQSQYGGNRFGGVVWRYDELRK
jgi:hypothetical protein